MLCKCSEWEEGKEVNSRPDSSLTSDSLENSIFITNSTRQLIEDQIALHGTARHVAAMAAAASTSTMDPLRLLRHSITAKSEIILLDKDDSSPSPESRVHNFSATSYVSFSDPSVNSSSTASDAPRLVFPKATPTRFKRTPQSTASETWDLQALILCYMQREASIAEYAQEAVKEGVELVGIMQRKIVAEYLDGTSREAAAMYIVPEAEGVNEDTSVEATLANAGQDATTTQEALANGTAAAATAAGGDAAASSARPAKKARYQVNKEDLEAYKRIVAQYEPKQLGDRSTVLRGDAKIVNFGNVRDLIADRLKSGKDELRKATHPNSGHHGSAAAASVPSASSSSSTQKRRRQANPIIIISPSSSALITMYNVKRFLEESIYEPSDIARAAGGRIAEDVVTINHKRQIGILSGDNARDDGGLSGQNKQERQMAGEKLTRYFVVDGVDALSKFGDDAWWVP